jgi:pantetheine-phosphate adenylyltransferase
MQKIAVYGGTFDPPTLGHVDIIVRGAALFDRVYVGVLVNCAKSPKFSMSERVDMLRKVTNDLPNVEVLQYDGLLARLAHEKGANYSIRGVRGGVDVENERPMFELNSEIAEKEFGFKLDTIFIPTTRKNFDTSSSNVRDLLTRGAFNVARTYLDDRIVEQVFAKYKK